MEKYVIEVRLTESEYVVDRNEVSAVYYNYDCSWQIDDGVLTLFNRADYNLVASFAAGAWQHIRRINE